MKSLTVSSNIHNYQVNFPKDLNFLDNLKHDNQCVFVIDQTVFELYPECFSTINENRLMLLSAHESIKTMESVFSIYRFLGKRQDKKNTHLVTIGGGILQDITGFAASTLYRGIRWTLIPTTLLAQEIK